MAISTDLRTFGKISEVIGAEAAAKLCGFFGGIGSSLSIPARPICGHVIERVIGRAAFILLIEKFGPGSLWVPKLDLAPLRRAGLVYALGRQGVSPSLQAALADCTPQRISQLRAELTLEGIDTSLLPADDEGGEHGH